MRPADGLSTEMKSLKFQREIPFQWKRVEHEETSKEQVCRADLSEDVV